MSRSAITLLLSRREAECAEAPPDIAHEIYRAAATPVPDDLPRNRLHKPVGDALTMLVAPRPEHRETAVKQI